MKALKGRIWAAGILALALGAGAAAQPRTPARHGGRAITVNDLLALARVSDPQISPDGRWVAYVVSRADRQANRMASNLWIVPAAGGEARQLTRGGSDSRPRWAPDSARLAFLSDRTGASEVYLLALAGGEARPVTHLSTGADNELWSPDGKTIAFTSRVFPDCRDDACNHERLQAREKSQVKARVYEHLLYRHWTEWWDGRRSHLFVVPAEGEAAPRDLTPGVAYDVPTWYLGGPDQIAFSPDGKQLCFSAKDAKHPAYSTNGDLFLVPADGSMPPRRITANPGDDQAPAYSPDGRWIAYRAQMRAGYESDRWRLMLYDRQTRRHINLTEDFDRSPEFFVWSPDSRTIYFPAEDRAEMPIFSIPAAGGTPHPLIAEGFNDELAISADGRTLVLGRSSMTMPEEIFTARADGGDVRQLTHQNAALLARLDLPAAETFWFGGAEGARVEGLLLRPPHFDPAKKYPLLFLVHGGPQGAFDNNWFYRWNAQVFASPGYVVEMVNPHGSTGYGQAFVDGVNGDWGGKPFVDLMKGLDFALAKYPFIDGSRMAAAGGSYGGYMMDWFASHTNGRFKCIISHAGVYDLVSEYGATEELWFPEWEMRGTPWTNPAMYARWSPNDFAGDFGKYKTPMLIITGERDFRVPYTQSLELFTALRRQGVPAKLVVFPDEGHLVLKPENSAFWYKMFLGWLAAYLKP
jgi:dipeptidyl aminopeptidase/acylaminoacyl peptidase